MYSKASKLLVTNCTFDKNKNGAIVIKCYFSENIAQYGGAASEYGGMTEISDS